MNQENTTITTNEAKDASDMAVRHLVETIESGLLPADIRDHILVDVIEEMTANIGLLRKDYPGLVSDLYAAFRRARVSGGFYEQGSNED
jgi:hypothetical protein